MWSAALYRIYFGIGGLYLRKYMNEFIRGVGGSYYWGGLRIPEAFF